MTEEEITLETIDEKIDEISTNVLGIVELINRRTEEVTDKEVIIIDILNSHTTALNNIIQKLNTDSATSTIPPTPVAPSQFKIDLQAKIDEGLPYDQVKDWIIEVLTTEGIYSEADIVIKIFTDIEGDIILEVKSRPYIYWGRLLQYLQDAMGDADKFETSRYVMKTIQWWKLTKNQQMEDQESDSSIIDAVTHDWGDNDDVNQHIGNG